jgi:hypothetical protein
MMACIKMQLELLTQKVITFALPTAKDIDQDSQVNAIPVTIGL